MWCSKRQQNTQTFLPGKHRDLPGSSKIYFLVNPGKCWWAYREISRFTDRDIVMSSPASFSPLKNLPVFHRWITGKKVCVLIFAWNITNMQVFLKVSLPAMSEDFWLWQISDDIFYKNEKDCKIFILKNVIHAFFIRIFKMKFTKTLRMSLRIS